MQESKPYAVARVWTHRDGRKANGLLVAVSPSNIRLVVSGRMFTVPRDELSLHDRYILPNIPDSEQGRERYTFLHLPGDSVRRTWTDDRGRQFFGELVAVWGNSLMLQKGERVYIVSPKRLSATDRLVVQQTLGLETRIANLVR